MRDIRKYIAEYEAMGERKRGCLYVSDIQQIYDIAEEAGKDIKEAMYTAICSAMMAGYMIGYRRAKREEAQRRKAERRAL